MQDAPEEISRSQFSTEHNEWFENFKAEFERSTKQHELNRVILALNRRALAKNKATFDRLKCEFTKERQQYVKNLELSKLNKDSFKDNRSKNEQNKEDSQKLLIAIDEAKAAISLQKNHYERIKFAEFLMEFTPIDLRITGIPALVKAQEIAELDFDPMHPTDWPNNVVAKLDWEISNNDILVSRKYLDSWITRRINYTENEPEP